MSGPPVLHRNPRLAQCVRVLDYLFSVGIAFAGTYLTICALASHAAFPNVIFDAIVMAIGVFFTLAACESQHRRVQRPAGRRRV